MKLNDEIIYWENKLYKLSYEKIIILERMEIISKEMTEITGVINAFKHASGLPEDTKDGNLHSKHNESAGDDLGARVDEGQPGAHAESPTTINAGSNGTTRVQRQRRRIHGKPRR